MPDYRNTHRIYSVEATPEGDSYRVHLGDREVIVEAVERLPGALRLCIEGRWHTVALDAQGAVRWLTWEGHTYRVERQTTRARTGGSAGPGDGLLRAPMPGQVRAVKVAEGEHVHRGQVVLLLEAMKMEIRIQAPFPGTVTRLQVQEGDVVEREAVLAEITPESS